MPTCPQGFQPLTWQVYVACQISIGSDLIQQRNLRDLNGLFDTSGIKVILGAKLRDVIGYYAKPKSFKRWDILETSVSLHEEQFMLQDLKGLHGMHQTFILKVDSINLQAEAQVKMYYDDKKNTEELNQGFTGQRPQAISNNKLLAPQ